MAATTRATDPAVTRLEDQVRELRAALEDAAEAICRVDMEGRVISVNRAFTRLAGYLPEEIVGRSWEDVVAPSDRSVVRADMRASADKVDRDVHGVRKDGTPFDMCLAVVAVTDGNPTRPTNK